MQTKQIDGVFLFAHGSSLDSWQAHFIDILNILRQGNSSLPCGLGFLERAQPDFLTGLGDLIQQIISLKQQNQIEVNNLNINVVPLFLAHSNHTAVDLPLLAKEANKIYPNVNLHFAKALLENQGFKNIMSEYLFHEYFV